jgi:hypothetical protein
LPRICSFPLSQIVLSSQTLPHALHGIKHMPAALIPKGRNGLMRERVKRPAAINFSGWFAQKGFGRQLAEML